MAEVTERPECANHKPIQHRDGLKKWCRECGWADEIVYVPAEKLSLSRAEKEEKGCQKRFSVNTLTFGKSSEGQPFGGKLKEIKGKLEVKCSLEVGHVGECTSTEGWVAQ